MGLGNPGREYEDTRHNVGYKVIEAILRRQGDPYEQTKARSRVACVRVDDRPVWVARPQTFMNRSGAAVAALLDHAEADPAELLVVCDDLNLELGGLRLRPRGSHGGHNGLLSIIETLGTQEFARLRLGIGPADPGTPHADFVLSPFRRREQSTLRSLLDEAADCAETAVRLGITAAMNRYNGTSRAGATQP